jgi:hypothetical protein
MKAKNVRDSAASIAEIAGSRGLQMLEKRSASIQGHLELIELLGKA